MPLGRRGANAALGLPGPELTRAVAPDPPSLHEGGGWAERSRRTAHDRQTCHSTALRSSIRAARSLGDISVAKRQTAAKAAFMLSGIVSRRPQLVQTLVQTVIFAAGSMPS